MTDQQAIRERLREHLEQLRGELAEVESLDPDKLDSDTKRLLHEAANSIHAALGDEAAEDYSHDTVAGQLEEIGEDFHDSHPSLSKIVGGIIDALGRMGI